MAILKQVVTVMAVLAISSSFTHAQNYMYNTTPKPTYPMQVNKTEHLNETLPHNETKVEIENSEPHKLKCQNFKVGVKLLHPPPSPRGSEGFDQMECAICDNIRLIYRCYPCFQSLKFLGINHLPDNETAAVFIMKFGCEGKHLKVLEAILKPHSIVHAECFEPECPPESPEIHLVQPCIVPEITQCSAHMCQAPETYTVTPFPTDCPPAVPPQIPMISPHQTQQEHHIPPPHHVQLSYPLVHSPYPDPYNHATVDYVPTDVHATNAETTDGHKGEAPEENHSEKDQHQGEKASDDTKQQHEEGKEENKPAQPQAVGVVGQTFVNGQMQPQYPYQQPFGFPSQVPAAPVPYPYGACHPTCAHVCSTSCHPACCRSKFTPKTRYRAYLQKLRGSRIARGFYQG